MKIMKATPSGFKEVTKARDRAYAVLYKVCLELNLDSSRAGLGPVIKDVDKYICQRLKSFDELYEARIDKDEMRSSESET